MEFRNYNKATINQISIKGDHTGSIFMNVMINGAEWKKKCENQLIIEKLQ